MSEERGTFWASLLNHGISFVLSLAVTAVAAQILVRSFEGPQDVSGESSEKMLIAKREWAKKHGADTPFPDLTAFEQTVMQDMIFPSQINASFDDIGGLDQTKRELFETVLLPLTHPHLYQSMNSTLPGSNLSNSNSNSLHSPINSLLSAPTGVLFYGPPGCGKTIMAKAIAQSADCTFIQCNFATLISKYYGESEKFIAALFSVSRKFAPAVIFIDEVDMYLGKRGSGDREQESRMKAQFLSLWDGLTSHHGSVLVLGATNRPFDLDEAILRRFSKQILFDLPSPQERLHILNVLLSGHVALDDGVLEYVSMKTNGFSGSDLKELSKRAAMEAVREHIYKIHQQRSNLQSGSTDGTTTTSQQSLHHSSSNLSQSSSLLANAIDTGRPRSTTKADFDVALQEVQPTGQQSMDYLKRFYNQSGTVPTRFTQGVSGAGGSGGTTQGSSGQGGTGKGGNRPVPPLIPSVLSINVTPGTQGGGKQIKKKGAGTASTTGPKGGNTVTSPVVKKNPEPQTPTEFEDIDEGSNNDEDNDEYQEFQE